MDNTCSNGKPHLGTDLVLAQCVYDSRGHYWGVFECKTCKASFFADFTPGREKSIKPETPLNPVLEYRRKLESLTGDNKRIWQLANAMMNHAIGSEQNDRQGCYKASEREGDKARQAQNELLDLLAGKPMEVKG